MVGLCLAAIFAVAAVAATSASALPEWGKCEKLGTPTGAYSDVNCTTKAKPKLTGEYKWVKGSEIANVKFTGKNVGSGGVLTTFIRACLKEEPEEFLQVTRTKCTELGGENLEEEEPFKVECEEEFNTGEAVGKNTVAAVAVKFTGCKLFGSAPCGNGEEGEVNTNLLKGKLGYISKSEKTVGVLLEPVVKHGEFAKFTCVGFITTVVGVGNKTAGAYYEDSPGVENHGGYDGIIGEVTPTNTMTTKYTNVFAENGKAENVPSKFEGKHIELLEDYIYPVEFPGQKLAWSRAGQEITAENTAETAGELKA